MSATTETPLANSFAALDECPKDLDGNINQITETLAAIDTAAIEVTEEKTSKNNARRNGKVFTIGEFATTPEVKLSGLLNNTEHYLELAQEAINCLCNRAHHTIQRRLEKLTSGTTSMNILGPIFKDEFYVRLNPTRWAFVKESALKSREIDIDGTVYVLNPQDAIRIWDIICGPNDRPTLFRDKKIESLGEKLQRLIQEDTRKDLIKEGKLKETDEYKPSVWLFLAYRRNFRNRQDPCRFISMCWDSDGTTPDRLMPVSDYCKRVERRPYYEQKNNQSRDKHRDVTNQSQRRTSRQLNQPTQTGHL